jgi:hypothetical protein
MNHLLHLFVELWIHKGGCAISVQHYLRMAPFHSSYMGKWHKKLHIFLLLWCQISYFLTKLWQCEPYGPFGQDQKWLRHTFWTVKQIANITSSMFSLKVMSIWNCLFLVDNFPKMAAINNGFNDCFRVLIFCVSSR